jgi:hypothetical protein
MSKQNYAGLDYSGPGSTVNRDVATGIRYGVISQHSLSPDVMSDIWSEARDLSYEAAVEEVKSSLRAICKMDSGMWDDCLSVLKDCGIRDETLIPGMTMIATHLEDTEDSKVEQLWDYVEQGFNDRYESDGRSWLWEKDGYALENCLQSDVCVLKSPYFTYAQFCSPCVPGACNLDNPFEGLAVPSGRHASFAEDYGAEAEAAGFARCYCLGHDMFEGEKAPYEVFSVATGKRVVMVEKKEECPSCNGSGSVTYNPNLNPNAFPAATAAKCGRCGGLGYEVKKEAQEQ